jgi:hypothetical protein
MAFDDDVRTVYEYLITEVLPSGDRPKVAYRQIEQATHVPIGEYGGHIGEILGEIQRRCAERKLPPLSSIVVNATDQIPGPGYFVALTQVLEMGNAAGWRIDPGVERWDQRPAPPGFDKRAERWNYRAMIDENQQAVWARTDWPESI